MSDISEKLFDETVRVEAIIWIPGAVADPESTPDAFREGFFEDIIDGNTDELMRSLPGLKRALKDSEFAEVIDVAEALLFVPGFLVKLATPIREFYADGGSSFSWGCCRTGWIYVEKEVDLEPSVINWARAEVGRQKAKAAAKADAA
jgi:hypothetical protein